MSDGSVATFETDSVSDTPKAHLNLRRPRLRDAWIVALLLLLIPIKDTHTITAAAAYEHAHQLFLHGFLEKSQLEAAQGYSFYHDSNPDWGQKFQLLEAEIMVRRGLGADALQLLGSLPHPQNNPELMIQELTLEGAALTSQQNFSMASQRLTGAEALCAGAKYAACGGVLRARGILEAGLGNLAEAQGKFLDSLSFARTDHDRRLEESALANLGWVSLQNEHYDEAIGWFRSAYDIAVDLGAGDLAQLASGNLGWAYFKLGDKDRALELFLNAEHRAASLGNIYAEIAWKSNAGYLNQDAGDLEHAVQKYDQSLELAKQIGSKQDIINALEDLTHASIDAGKLDEANSYIGQVGPLVSAGGNRLDALDVMLAKARIDAARHEDLQAETEFRAVERDPASQVSMRMGAEHELARLFEREGKADLAGRMYKTALTTFESARTDLKNENSKLPFLANATGIYDDYIHFLVVQGHAEEALLAADQSRARTLAQGLGMVRSERTFQPDAFSPREVARKTGATLLFYWLGNKQSYLWAVTPDRVALFPLPGQKEIAPLVERYSRTLLGNEDPLRTEDQDGRQLYHLLVEPALKVIRANTPVVVLADGSLTRLNFETLLAPGPDPLLKQEQNADRGAAVHYLIDDATLSSAPSLAMLAAAKPARQNEKNLLLIGNPISPNKDFPSLPLFGFEMKQIEKNFDSGKAAVYGGQQASPAAYVSSNPAQYSYIHFVAHAIASRTDPLDSAIILSSNSASDDSFKLYAREIVQHPIDARLVTISACYGSGTRFYAGEGLVGLSWAFLRAGAHNVIGALWEVSDESTPRLMESLYGGIQQGQSPAVALRGAKLVLMHSKGKFSSPFYWAPFQLYYRY